MEYKATEGNPISYNISLESMKIIEGESTEAKTIRNLSSDLSLKMAVIQTTTETNEGNLEQEMIVEGGKIIQIYPAYESTDEEDIDKGEKLTLEVKKNGKFSENFEGKLTESYDIKVLAPRVIFSNEPVSSGDTWTGAINLSNTAEEDNIEIQYKYVLEKFETINDLNCAVIKFETLNGELEIENASVSLFSNGTMHFAFKTGIIVRYSLSNKVILKSSDKGLEDTVITFDDTVLYELRTLKSSGRN
ncbi:MAG: hypothetical protein KKA19_03425 [Candidatus Margulisbacteria bacterium]|nr:hypothetical protein [Candidatus Margulisiibacteriota bacterium]